MGRKKRKLKGIMVEKMPLDKKEKMEKTLEKMVEIREEDNRNLRTDAEAKLKWATEEEKRLEETIKKFIIMKHRVRGAIIVLNELLNPPKPEEEEDKKE